MTEIIIANLLFLLTVIPDTVSASRKNPKAILGWQTVSQMFYGVGSLLLNAPSASVQNLVNIFRNLFAISDQQTRAVQWALTVLGVVLGALFNNRGLWGWLPIVASLLYSLTVLFFGHDERKLKIVFAITLFVYAIFNIPLYNVVGAISNSVVFVSTVVFLLRDRRANT